MNKKTEDQYNIRRIGVHSSIAGGVSMAIERAASLNASTLQMFSHSPRQWNRTVIQADEAERFADLREKHDINPAFIHSSYLINLASLTGTVVEKSVALLSYELMNADLIGAEYVVLHTGSAQGDDEDVARSRAAKSLKRAVSAGNFSSSIILENTSGKKGDLTSSIKSLAVIMDRCNSKTVSGICLDTCHAFAAGYDLRTPEGTDMLLSEIEEYIGLDKVKLIHLNDSKGALGTGIDRHEHIGEGHIGIDGFRNILGDKRLSGVPIVLETPKKDEGDDRRNLDRVISILNECDSP